MNRKIVLLVIITIVAAIIFASHRTEQVNAEPVAQVGSQPAFTEVWKTGVTLETNTDYQFVAGRLLSGAASFRSSSAEDIFFVFPAPASARTVTEAKIHLLSRSGAYSGSAVVQLEVRDLTGALVHTVTGLYDPQVAALNVWTELALSADINDLTINPGEYLCAHFFLNSTAQGDLDVRPIFEITLE